MATPQNHLAVIKVVGVGGGGVPDRQGDVAAGPGGEAGRARSVDPGPAAPNTL